MCRVRYVQGERAYNSAVERPEREGNCDGELEDLEGNIEGSGVVEMGVQSKIPL